MAIRGHEGLGDVRVVDLVAKTAKASLKDTIRVLIAAKAIADHFSISLDDMVPGDFEFDHRRASPQNVAACEQAYSTLETDARVPQAIQKYR